MIVNFCDHILDIGFWNVEILLLYNFRKFRSQDHSCSIYIDGLELFSQLCDLLFICHFYKNIHSCSLKFWHSFEVPESVDDVNWYGWISDFPLTSLSAWHSLKPVVIKGFSTCESLLRIRHEQFWYQIFALVWDDLELFVVEMEISSFDFIKNFFGVISLEWEITRNKSVQQHTKTPNISLSLIAAMKYLRCHVVRSTSHVRQIFWFASSW